MTNSKAGRPVNSFTGKYPTTENGKPTRTYRKWQSMHARCYGTHPSAEQYKSRGIGICDRWRGHGGYDCFVDDMGFAPEGLTLERINNDKGYAPDNCKWATWQEQANNRTHSGKLPNPLSMMQKAKTAGLPYAVVYLRVRRLGWSVEKALSTPKNAPGKWDRKSSKIILG